MARRYYHKNIFLPVFACFLGVVLLCLFFMDQTLYRQLRFYLFTIASIVLLSLLVCCWYLYCRRQMRLHALRVVDIDGMSGRAFEQYLAFLIKKQGYKNVTLTPYQGDWGADLIASKNGKKYAIQAKRYTVPVGVEALYQCFGGQKYYHCTDCMVITNSTFTPQARELARQSHTILVDRSLLEHWIVTTK